MSKHFYNVFLILFISIDLFSIPVDDLFTLRNQPPGPDFIYELVGEVYVNYTYTYQERKEIYVQDADAGIKINDRAGIIITEYSIGDGITGIFGWLDNTADMLSFIPIADPGAPSSIDNEILPILVDLEELNINLHLYQARYVKIDNVSINWYGWLLENMTFQLRQGIISFPMKTKFLNTDYIGAFVFYYYAYNISGIVLSDFSVGFLTHRFLSDIENQNNSILYYPYRLEAEQHENRVSLSWDPPSWFFSHAGYDGCTYHIEIDNINEFSIAHRYNPAQLKTYGVAGSKLYSLLFPYMVDQAADHTVNIYLGGSANPLNPGRLVHTQQLEEFQTDPYAGLLLIYLTEPIDIPTTEELWIELKVDNFEQEYIWGDAHSRDLDGYGNLLFINGEWTTATTLYPDFVWNWSLIPGAVLPTTPNSLRGEVTPNTNFLGYKIYRSKGFEFDDNYIPPVALTPEPIFNTFFEDELPEPWVYFYDVYAVYDVGYSNSSEKHVINNYSIIDYFPWSYSFNNEIYLLPFPGWTTLPIGEQRDGWRPHPEYSGAVSWTFSNIVDNWLISPKFVLPTDQPIDFNYKTWVCSFEMIENYSVLISTTDTQIESFEEVFTETMADPLAQSRTIDLSEYQGQTIYIAFRHHQSNYPYGNLFGNNNLRLCIGDFEIGSTFVFEKEVITPMHKTELHANYPNPFNPSTTINFTLSLASNLRIDIYNIKGQKVKTVVDALYPAGSHSVIWNGTDDNGFSVSSGVYFYKMTADDYVGVGKMVLMK